MYSNSNINHFYTKKAPLRMALYIMYSINIDEDIACMTNESLMFKKLKYIS